MDIIYSVEPTLKSFLRNNKVSWSHFDTFQSCQGSWFIKYFLKSPPELCETQVVREDTRAVPGTLIQKLMEVFVNERVYTRPEMGTLSAIYEWFTKNTRLLFQLSTFPIDEQFKQDFLYTKDFWKKGRGRALWQVALNNGLDPCIRDINISFLDPTAFERTYESPEKFLEKVANLYPEIIGWFAKQKFDLDWMWSEIPLRVELPKRDISLTGSIDFIYNPKQKDGTYFSSLAQLQNGYFLFDGKYKFSSYTKEEQLSYYSLLLYLQTGKLPDTTALLSWTEAKMKEFTFDLGYKEKVETVLTQLLTAKKNLIEILDKKKENTGWMFGENLVPLCPSESICQFCSAVEFCPAAVAEGISGRLEDSEQIFSKLLAKRAAKNAISTLSEEDRSRGEITL